jgi:gamma-butyrobetaine dioxygenase
MAMDSGEAMLARIEALFAADPTRGQDRVTLAEHMLQSAAAAREAGADDALVAAALLHDIGHWLHDEQAGPLDAGDDDNHGTAGERFLGDHFGVGITRPIGLHVAAKRYLCAREPGYHERLSAASVRSLGRQGGAMPPAQAARFERDPAHEAAVALRRWDEYGKIPGLSVPGITHYRDMLMRLMAGAAGAP